MKPFRSKGAKTARAILPVCHTSSCEQIGTVWRCARRCPVRRFWSKVTIAGPDDCWLWKRAGNGSGYGMIWMQGTQHLAHRVAFAIAHDGIGAGVLGCHSCDNPTCVNPRHIFAGDYGVNSRDMYAKGRENNPVAEANRLKTHCPQGHPYSGDNLYLYKDGRRSCWACIRWHRFQITVRRRQAKAAL